MCMCSDNHRAHGHRQLCWCTQTTSALFMFSTFSPLVKMGSMLTIATNRMLVDSACRAHASKLNACYSSIAREVGAKSAQHAFCMRWNQGNHSRSIASTATDIVFVRSSFCHGARTHRIHFFSAWPPPMPAILCTVCTTSEWMIEHEWKRDLFFPSTTSWCTRRFLLIQFIKQFHFSKCKYYARMHPAV